MFGLDIPLLRAQFLREISAFIAEFPNFVRVDSFVCFLHICNALSNMDLHRYEAFPLSPHPRVTC